MKLAPAPDLSGLSSSVQTQWTEVPGQGYYVCWDTTNNNACDTTWWPNGGATSRVLTDLAPGTYYWQVLATDGTLFNGGAWWAFTVGAPVVSFNKVTPAAGTILTTNNMTLSWTTAPGASFYETCLDTVNNGICDTAWQTNAQATSRLLTNLTDGVYYWQVRATTANGNATADNGAWWTLTIDAPDPIREYIYAGGKLLASLTLTTGAPVLTYYHTDVLGSVRAITSATGAPLTRNDYAPFGESTSPLGGDPRRFLGQMLDAESAFDHFGARYYRNVWGRFASVDPIVSGAVTNPQKWNRYAYGLNNPLRFVDPSGLDAEGGDFPIEEGSFGCSAICQEFDDWANSYVYENENIAPLLELLRKWAEEEAAKRAAREQQSSALHLDPQFIQWSKDAWMRAALGTANTESGFMVFKASGGYRFEWLPVTNEPGRITFGLKTGTIAVVHTHPNALDIPRRGDHDSTLRDKYRIPFYVLTNRGLWVHDSGGGAPMMLRPDTSWLNPPK